MTILGRFPATGTDTAAAITRAATLHRLGLRLEFGSRLDADRLARAVRLSLDAEPILGCSFETGAFRPFWSRLTDLDSAPAFSVAETADPDGAMDVFQAEEVDDAGPQARVILLRTSDTDELGIKVSHVVADGQAAKQYAYLLASIYTALGTNPAFTPEPNLRPRPTGADVWSCLTPAQRKAAKQAKSWASPTWEVPFASRSGVGLTYRTTALEPREFSAMRSYGKNRGATVNDMLLTAVLRTCIRAFDPPSGVPLSLMCTADLRRYLPDTAQLPIANISISGSLDIERVDDEDFDDTLQRVRERMNAWASTCHGAAPMMMAEKMTALGYRATKALLGAAFTMGTRSGKAYPWFTNIGVIEDERLAFDTMRPTSAHVFGPASPGPSVVPVISTYRDTLTVCMGSCEHDCDRGMIDGLLAGIDEELAARA